MKDMEKRVKLMKNLKNLKVHFCQYLTDQIKNYTGFPIIQQ